MKSVPHKDTSTLIFTAVLLTNPRYRNDSCYFLYLVHADHLSGFTWSVTQSFLALEGPLSKVQTTRLPPSVSKLPKTGSHIY
jgi:uncharacterized protein (UPF0548 family)